jgi:hypothetical protein
MAFPDRRTPRHMRLAAMGALAITGLAAAGSAPLGGGRAQAQPRQCFRTLEWHNSSAGGPHDLYLRVGVHQVWHLGMKQECPGARFPGPVRIADLVTGGTDQICSAADLQIRVGQLGGGFTTPCIVTSMELLTPEQVKALPRKVVP